MEDAAERPPRGEEEHMVKHQLLEHAPVDYPTLKAHEEFPHSVRTPGAARAFARDTLAQWGLEHVEHLCLLLLSEVVTNAVVHGKSAPKVTLLVEGGTLEVAVKDESPTAPSRVDRGTLAVGGRGVMLVDTLAHDWGICTHDDGKVVWFTLLAA